MAKHEFGIMERTPLKGERYDEYNSDKYNCVEIDDKLIEPLLFSMDIIFKSYYHSIDIQGDGLNYCGIILIPPESLEEFKDVLENEHNKQYGKLIALIEKAMAENKFVIHFGI